MGVTLRIQADAAPRMTAENEKGARPAPGRRPNTFCSVGKMRGTAPRPGSRPQAPAAASPAGAPSRCSVNVCLLSDGVISRGAKDLTGAPSAGAEARVPPALAQTSCQSSGDSWRGLVPGLGAGSTLPPGHCQAVSSHRGLQSLPGTARPPGYEGPASQGVRLKTRLGLGLIFTT